jgi:hypothetical protein
MAFGAFSLLQRAWRFFDRQNKKRVSKMRNGAGFGGWRSGIGGMAGLFEAEWVEMVEWPKLLRVFDRGIHGRHGNGGKDGWGAS